MHILGLDGGHLGELGVDVVEMEEGDLLVEDLGQDVDARRHTLDRGLGLSLVDLLLGRGTGVFGLGGTGELDVLLGELLVAGLVQHDLRQHLVGEGARHDEG